MKKNLTHFDAQGQAHMVDVAAKGETHRIARAGGRISMQAATLKQIVAGSAKKGDVLGVARIAAGGGRVQRGPQIIRRGLRGERGNGGPHRSGDGGADRAQHRPADDL